jgi:dihydroorotase
MSHPIRRGAGVLLLALAAAAGFGEEPPYDLLIRGGRVLDPKSHVDGVRDVAVAGGRIAAVAAAIPADRARQVVDAAGRLVVPGLVDIHTHVFWGTDKDAYLSDGPSALPPDGFTLRTCVTTAVDAGGAGWRSFPRFKERVVDRSKTRVLAWLNVVGSGMRGGPVEQDLGDMDARLTALRIREFPEIVGVKVAHYSGPGWEPVDRAVEAGRLAGVPVMVDFGEHVPELPLKDLLLIHLRPGDVFTHAYAHVEGRIPIVGEDGRLRPYVQEARRRGVLFDVGHGAGSFVFEQAVPALEQGFAPDSISSDLHADSMNGGMKDLPNVMSKLIALGLGVEDVVLRATWNPARTIRRSELGHLGVGAAADIAVLAVREGRFGFVDVSGRKVTGSRKLECELTVRDGKVAWDLNGLSSAEWK